MARFTRCVCFVSRTWHVVNQSTNQLRPFFPSTPPFLACLPNPAKVGTSVLLPALGLREENTSASHTPKAYVSRLHIHNYTLHSSYSHKSTIGRRSQADHGTLASFLRLRLTRGLSCFWIDTPPPSRPAVRALPLQLVCTRPTIR